MRRARKPPGPPPLKTVAALCVGPRSIYKTIPEVDAYDHNRNAWTYPGDLPIIGHPPCRSWSNKLRHQAKPDPGEQELALQVVEWLRRYGGILEHPAHSHLYDACGLPRPGRQGGPEWTAEVLQYWWGTPNAKTTWLCFFHIPPNQVHLPLRLYPLKGSQDIWSFQTTKQRAATTPQMAQWLVATAKRATPPHAPATTTTQTANQ